MTQKFWPQVLAYTPCAQSRSTAEILLSYSLKREHLFKESRCRKPGVLSGMIKKSETQSNSLTSLNENIDQMSLFCQKTTQTTKPQNWKAPCWSIPTANWISNWKYEHFLSPLILSLQVIIFFLLFKNYYSSFYLSERPVYQHFFP